MCKIILGIFSYYFLYPPKSGYPLKCHEENPVFILQVVKNQCKTFEPETIELLIFIKVTILT